MPALKKSKAVEAFWKIHAWLYKRSGGKLGGKTLGMPVLLLTTKGRKSGRERSVALTHLVDGERFVVIASYLGEPRHPAWWLNLRADPSATVQVGGRSLRVRAREAEGQERERLWKQAASAMPDYDVYQERTSRRIPVVVLEPVS